MKQLQYITIVLFLLLNQLEAKDYTKLKRTQQFINMMTQKHHFKKAYLSKLFSNVTLQQNSLNIYNPRPKSAIVRPRKSYPKDGVWTRYAQYLLTPSKIELGSTFLRKYRTSFLRAYKEYGVPPEYIAAIIGIETRYGVKMGTYPIFDVLTTLAFEKNRRNSYFKKELEEYLLLTRENKTNPRSIKGSYAGAIGFGQFMPRSFKPFAVDFNGDGKKSMHHIQDAIGSIANYLKLNGWKKWQPVATCVAYKGNRYNKKPTGYRHLYPQSQLKEFTKKDKTWNYQEPVCLIKLNRYKYDEMWFGAKNFYVITRYNHSDYYAMAVHQIAQKLLRDYKERYKEPLR